MTTDEKKGSGGKRPGAGRPHNHLKGVRFTFYLEGNDADLLKERADEEGVSPYTWIVKTIREALRRR